LIHNHKNFQIKNYYKKASFGILLHLGKSKRAVLFLTKKKIEQKITKQHSEIHFSKTFLFLYFSYKFFFLT
jgi:hypothetical protein